MGEAKRRREAANPPGQETTFFNMASRQVEGARDGGMPAGAYLDAVMDQARARANAEVPCNGCTACCYHEVVEVDPAEETPADLSYQRLIQRDDGTYALPKRADGGCAHLGDVGCSIHRHRPYVCRAYDCRLSSLAGVAAQYQQGKHREPIWVFETKTTRDAAIVATLQISARRYIQEAENAGQRWEAQEAVKAAFMELAERLPQMIEVLDKGKAIIEAMSPDQQRALVAEIKRQMGYPAG